MIKAGIIGATGYAGAELAGLLYAHAETEILFLGSRTYTGQPFSSVYPAFRGKLDMPCADDDIAFMAREADVIFTATPQGFLAGVLTEEILGQTRVIDLSADYRLKDVSVYEEWYKLKHASPSFLAEAVYGLCEINRKQIKDARLVANPGCYTTCSILTCYPAVKEGLIDADTLIIDALSGVSGAGANAKKENLYCEVNERVKPYGVAVHRHTPEIEEQLSYAAGRPLTLSFTPHLVPMNRGILATCYATLKEGVTEKNVREAYESYYGKEPFIRLLPEGAWPETRFVEHTNLLDIGLKADARTNRLILCGAIDNLVKGAAGQAVQNMNILFGLGEQTGLV